MKDIALREALHKAGVITFDSYNGKHGMPEENLIHKWERATIRGLEDRLNRLLEYLDLEEVHQEEQWITRKKSKK